MAKPIFHAISARKKFGGEVDDYLDIHTLMDLSKSAVADHRHRVLTHNAWFVGNILERIFGVYRVIPTTDEGRELQAKIDRLEVEQNELREEMRVRKLGRVVAVREIGEQHVLEDFAGKFIPTVQDYIDDGKMISTGWMANGVKGSPPSYRSLTREFRRDVIDIT